MRVLHINSGRMFGGVERLLVTLARQAPQCPDMTSSFAVCFPGRFSEELTAAGATVYDLGSVRASWYWTVLLARRRLRMLLQRERFDAVVCHMPWNFAVFAPEIRRSGKLLVFWQHGLAYGKGWIERWARKTCPDLAISNSKFTAGTLPLLFPKVNQQMIYYPVEQVRLDANNRSRVRKDLGVSSGQVVIVQVSRMEPWKGHALHLRALAELRDEPDWVCWMVGGPQNEKEAKYLQELKAMAADLGIMDRVRFLGASSNVPEVLNASDIFCQPNQEPEPFGIVFIEALAADLPVVTTDLGGGAEIVTDSEGVLVPADHRSLAAGLRRLLEHPEIRQKLGRSGPQRARSLCDPRVQLRCLHDSLLSALHGPVYTMSGRNAVS